MGQYVDSDDFRGFLAGKIEELGDEESAERVREGRASEGVKAAGWSAVVFAAMLTPEELRRAADEGVELRAPTGEVTTDNFDSLLIDLEPGSSRKPPGGGG